jgi:hypothetical protein
MFEEDYESERKKRDENRRTLGTQRTRLKHLRRLEEILETTSKRPVPVRNQNDSLELHASKKTRVKEVPANILAGN